MISNLKIYFDPIGDILHIERGELYSRQISREVAEGVVGRFNPETGELESLEILSPSDELRTMALLLESDPAAQADRRETGNRAGWLRDYWEQRATGSSQTQRRH